MNQMQNAEKFMQAVNAMKQTLDIPVIDKNLDVEIAVRYNLRRKFNMIRSMQRLYAYLHGNGPKPTIMPSVAFNPCEGTERTNLHYIFKYMSNTPPWDLRKDLLVAPVAATLFMIDIMTELFPDVIVHRYKLLVQEFINRWTLPKLRPEWSDEELTHEINRYRSDMESLETRFRQMYVDLSGYFIGLETPEQNPVRKEISETHKHAREIARKICGEEPKASYIAQEEAYRIWTLYKNSSEVKLKYCNKDHRVSYADVFDYCHKQLYKLGFRTYEKFEKAILSVKKRKLRLGNETK